MSGKAPRRKGNGGELEVAGVFQAVGFDARRTPNSGGLTWKGDIQGVPGYCIEVKRQETLAIPAWLRQVYADAEGRAVPVLVFRRDGRGTSPDGRWHAVLPLDELARLIEIAQRAERGWPHLFTPRALRGQAPGIYEVPPPPELKPHPTPFCDLLELPGQERAPADTGAPGCDG